MRDPNRPQPIVPEGFIPGLSKARETILGPLMPWLGPRALEFIEGSRFRIIHRWKDAQTYAGDQLDRFLRGANLDPDVKILDLDNEPVARGPKEAPRLAWGQPITYIPPTHAEMAKDIAEKVDGLKAKGDSVIFDIPDPEAAPEYEPIGTVPVEGDSAAHVTGDGVPVGLVGYDIAAAEWMSLGDRRWPEISFKTGEFRILKRPDAEAEGWYFRADQERYCVVGDTLFISDAGEVKWRRPTSENVTPEYFRRGFLEKNPEGWARATGAETENWLAEVKKAGLL